MKKERKDRNIWSLTMLRFKNDFLSIIVVNSDGLPVRTSMDSTMTVQVSYTEEMLRTDEF